MNKKSFYLNIFLLLFYNSYIECEEKNDFELIEKVSCCKFYNKYFFKCDNCSEELNTTCQIDGIVGKFNSKLCRLINRINNLKEQIEESSKKKSMTQEQFNTSLDKKISDDSNIEKNNVGTGLSRALLLHGQPGNGKTTIARKIAEAVGGGFFEIIGGDVVGEFSGQGPSRVRELFDAAKKYIKEKNAPAVIFFDEVDCITKNRKFYNGSQHDDSLMSLCGHVLNELQDNQLLVIICATNKLENLDPAFRSRFKRNTIEIKNPDSEDRKKVIEFYCSKYKFRLTDDLMKTLVAKSEGMSIRDIEEKIDEAMDLGKDSKQKSRYLEKLFNEKPASENIN